jgi:hypothetical protein
MRRLSFLAVLTLISFPALCQVMHHDTVMAPANHLFQPKKFNYGVTLGSQFASVSGYGSALNTFVTPRISYNVNKRLSIGGGVSLIQSNYFNARSYGYNEPARGSNGNFTSAMIFVEGQYLVNDRLTVYGSAFKQLPVTKDPLPYNPFNPVSARGAQGIDFNVGYRVGDHMYIQAGFHYIDGVNPYSSGPLNRNPFMHDPFGTQGGFGAPRW